ncbi:MAG: hypothetical protein WCT33_03880 [Patescibacteria group bacterium]|jgi:hypothetical protein
MNKTILFIGGIAILFIGVAIGLIASKNNENLNDNNAVVLNTNYSSTENTNKTNVNKNININTESAAPSGTFEIVSEIPSSISRNKIILDIQVTSSENARTIDAYKNGSDILSSMLLEEDGVTSVPLTLTPGLNTFYFKLGNLTGIVPEFYRTAEINYDNVPPRIETIACSKTGLTSTQFKNLKLNEEYLCISTGQYSGPTVGVAQAPLYGSITGNFEKITYDGKNVNPEPDGFINQRVPIYMNSGTNIFEIIAIDKAGNQAKTRETVEWEKEGDPIDLNIE